MIIEETPKPTTGRDKYKFADLEVGQCHVLNDIVYTHDDYRRALSASYQYRKYYNLLNKVEFSIRLNDNELKIYRTV